MKASQFTFLLVSLAAVFAFSFASEQCFVGQKLFSMESNRAVCAPFIQYGCVAKCEWSANCSTSQSWKAYKGRRSYVAGLLINGKSLLVLCCSSLATVVKSNKQCAYREYESVSVVGPSVRLDPVLGQSSYIREVLMQRETEGRVGLQLEVCNFEKEREHCKVEEMSADEKKRFERAQSRLARQIAFDEAKKARSADKRSITAVANTTKEDAPPAILTTTLSTTTTTTIEPTTTTTSWITNRGSRVNINASGEGKEALTGGAVHGSCDSIASQECANDIILRLNKCSTSINVYDPICLEDLEKHLIQEVARSQSICDAEEIKGTLKCYNELSKTVLIK